MKRHTWNVVDGKNVCPNCGTTRRQKVPGGHDGKRYVPPVLEYVSADGAVFSRAPDCDAARAARQKACWHPGVSVAGEVCGICGSGEP